MKWHYDVTGAEPIIRDLPFYSNATDYVAGIPLQKDAITTELNQFACVPATATDCNNIVGVTIEKYDYSEHKQGVNRKGSNGITAVATGACNYLQTIINPFAIYLAEYSQAAADDQAIATADSTGLTVTVAAFTTDRQGDWIYITDTGGTTGGAGNLICIGADAGGTTVATCCTNYDNALKANIVGDTCIWANGPYSTLGAANAAIDLASNLADLKSPGAAGSGAILVLQSYISPEGGPLEPLRVERHSGNNFKPELTKLYADVLLTDHIMGLTPRVIN